MNKKIFKLQYMTLLLAFLVLPIASGPVNADVIPVTPLNNTQQKFSPTVDGNYSQYIVPANYKNFGITYNGNASAPNPHAEYTDGTLGSAISLVTPGASLTRGSSLSSLLVDSQTTGNYNPFMPVDSNPVFVNMTDNQAYLTKQNSVSFSIHMGHSSTMFFNSSINYYILVNSTGPFFLNVEVFNPNANINLNLSQTLYPGLASYTVNKKQSVPVIPMVNGLQIINMTTQNGQNSLVTLTPLPFSMDSFGSTQVAAGQYYSDQVKQGSCTDLQTTSNYDSLLKTLGMQFFQFPIEADNTYQLYFYENPIYENSGSTYINCPAGGLAAARLDGSYKFNYVGGSLYSSTTGLVVNAKNNGYINISLISVGYVRENFGFFFQKANSFKIPTQHNLIFNKPISLVQSPNDYYTFTLQSPSMLAVNYTSAGTVGTSGNSRMYTYLSKLNTQTGSYQTLSTGTYQSTFSGLPLEKGALLNGTNPTRNDLLVGSGQYNWIYLPAGQYRFDTNGTFLTNNIDALFEFNLVPVQTFQNSISLTIKDKGIYAIQLPLDPMGYNYINASTTAHDNMSIGYDYGVIGAYRYYSTLSDSVTPQTGSMQLGNRLTTGGWVQYNSNATPLLQIDKPVLNNYVPIMLIVPTYGHNWNNSGINVLAHTFTTTLTITSNTNSSIHVATGYYGNGNLITSSTSVTGSTSVAINSDTVNSLYQLFAFKLTTNPDTLYKLSVSTLGNFTTTSNNATISSVYVASGDLYTTNFYGHSYSLNTSYEYRGEFLSSASTSYLFISVQRQMNNTVWQNSTLNINFSSLNVQPLSIQNLNNFNWNSTISNYEVVDTTPLWNITNYQYPGSGGGLNLVPLAIILGGGVVVAAVAGGVYYYRKKGKHP